MNVVPTPFRRFGRIVGFTLGLLSSWTVAQAAEPAFDFEQLSELARQNVVRALESVGWKIAGADGAAALLGMKPSTLASRIKALGIERPAR